MAQRQHLQKQKEMAHQLAIQTNANNAAMAAVANQPSLTIKTTTIPATIKVSFISHILR